MELLNVKDLRPGNLVNTELGIRPVHMVTGKSVIVEHRTPGHYLKKVKRAEPIIAEQFDFGVYATCQMDSLLDKEFKSVVLSDSLKYVHEIQNWYYWNSGKKELIIRPKIFQV